MTNSKLTQIVSFETANRIRAATKATMTLKADVAGSVIAAAISCLLQPIMGR